MTADAGTARLAGPSTVVWSGSLPAEDVVTIEADVRILDGTRGTEVAVQAVLIVEEEGVEVRSAPPGAAAPAPMRFVVGMLLDIPTASPWGAALLAALLCTGALGLLRRRRIV